MKAKLLIFRRIWWLIALVGLVAGCARGAQAFRHPEADLSAISRVAVIPFDNLTAAQFAGEKVTAIYISELLMNIDIEVVEPGEVARALQQNNVVGSLMSQSQIKSVGAALQADTLIFGSVHEYGRERFRAESYPVVSVSTRWVDVNTGTIIFMAVASAEGSPEVPVIDVGEEQLFTVITRDVCRKLITMVR
ncbi:MAG: hypothetical protein Kow0099_18990 [Candidatus Abyssubacteria bacterium]